MTPKAQATRAEINRVENVHNQSNHELWANGRKYFQLIYLQDVISRIHKKLQLNYKRNNPIKVE